MKISGANFETSNTAFQMRIESSQPIPQPNKNNQERITFSDNYRPDLSAFAALGVGEELSLSTWTDEQRIEFSQLTTKEIFKTVDLASTTQDEFRQTLINLERRGVIGDVSSVSITVGLDGNLQGDKKFNAIEYLEKNIQSMENVRGESRQTSVISNFRSTLHALMAAQDAEQLGQTFSRVDQWV